MKKVLLLLISGLSVHYCIAQTENTNSIAVAAIQGVTTYSAMDNKPKGTPQGVQVDYRINMANNTAAWVQALHVTNVSVGAYYLNTGNVSLTGVPNSQGALGTYYGIGAKVDMRLARIGAISMIFSPGVGAVYGGKNFSVENIPIRSSRINACFQGALKFEGNVSSNLTLFIGGSYYHSSNGSVQPPNYGFGAMNGFAGLAVHLNTSGPKNIDPVLGVTNHGSFELSLDIGNRGFPTTGYYKNPETGVGMWLTPEEAAKQTDASKLYHYTLYTGYNYRINQLLGLKIGTDVIYNAKTFSSWNDLFTTYEKSFTTTGHVSVGTCIGVDMWLGSRFALSGTCGYFVYNKFLYQQSEYISAGAKCFITPWMAGNVKVYMNSKEPYFVATGLSFIIGKK